MLAKYDGWHTGIVLWFSRGRGYGFARDEQMGEDVFIHKNHIIASSPSEKILHAGQKLRYRIEEENKGPSAFKIQILPNGAEKRET